ncbi:MAG: LptF/LptG family permease [Bacteroidales bacterium]|jgi:lipopolysaccharide export system permease protein|nr:LptF/LptG family permease [Bacteroidales bacterium]MBR4177036.1 LptF/LptG family permease [Bacteroidales bacterium]MCR4931290.1 LptF/LptG family permease [Bacteroidales bacterium]
MKKLDKLVIKSFVGPLILTFVVAVFVLLMQFIWKYVDDIAGKGLSVGIILELLMDASATFVPMAMPIAVLFASIMTMGNLGEHYELVAIKSGGIPLWRSMVPMGIIVAVLTVVAFIFADYVMPSAVLKYRTTLYDITRKKPALNIRPGEYYSEIDGFVIRVNKKDADGKTLHDITVYDHRFSSSQPDIVVAREGTMQTTPDERYMLFTLYDGCSYSETANDAGSESKPFTRIYFDTNKMTFDLSDFAFDKSDESIFQGGYQMMNTSQLDSNVARLKMQRSESIQKQIENIALRIDKNTVDSAGLDIQALCDSLEYHQQRRVYNEALSRAERCLSDVKIHDQVITSQSEYINRHYIEWHRKFTLSVACIVLFFVGAPFGSIVRKGGLGVPLVASVLFFVLYYVIGMIAEKAVREGAIGTVGMWISTFVMLPIGIYLTYKAVQR